jgi:hypothetical protein
MTAHEESGISNPFRHANTGTPKYIYFSPWCNSPQQAIFAPLSRLHDHQNKIKKIKSEVK